MGRETRKGYVRTNEGQLEHRAVWESHHGALPSYGWVVHHINFVKSDNRIENLVALPAWRHDELHAELRRGAKYTREQLLDMSQELLKTFTGHDEALQDAARALRAVIANLESTGIPTDQINTRLGYLLGTGPRRTKGEKKNKAAALPKKHRDPYSTKPAKGKSAKRADKITPYPWQGPIMQETLEQRYKRLFAKELLPQNKSKEGLTSP